MAFKLFIFATLIVTIIADTHPHYNPYYKGNGHVIQEDEAATAATKTAYTKTAAPEIPSGVQYQYVYTTENEHAKYYPESKKEDMPRAHYDNNMNDKIGYKQYITYTQPQQQQQTSVESKEAPEEQKYYTQGGAIQYQNSEEYSKKYLQQVVTAAPPLYEKPKAQLLYQEVEPKMQQKQQIYYQEQPSKMQKYKIEYEQPQAHSYVQHNSMKHHSSVPSYEYRLQQNSKPEGSPVSKLHQQSPSPAIYYNEVPSKNIETHQAPSEASQSDQTVYKLVASKDYSSSYEEPKLQNSNIKSALGVAYNHIQQQTAPQSVQSHHSYEQLHSEAPQSPPTHHNYESSHSEPKYIYIKAEKLTANAHEIPQEQHVQHVEQEVEVETQQQHAQQVAYSHEEQSSHYQPQQRKWSDASTSSHVSFKGPNASYNY